jgi:hypothetical protein
VANPGVKDTFLAEFVVRGEWMLVVLQPDQSDREDGRLPASLRERRAGPIVRVTIVSKPACRFNMAAATVGRREALPVAIRLTAPKG